MTRPRLVTWADVPPGAVAWDASPEYGGDTHASIAVRFPLPDDHRCDGVWIAAHGNPTSSSSGGWRGTIGFSAPGPAHPLAPDFAWNGVDFLLARDDGCMQVVADGLTVAECESLGAMDPATVRAWCNARVRHADPNVVGDAV